MVDQSEAELLGNPLLKQFKLLVDELDDVASLDIDQMVVVSFRRRLIARSAVAELVPLRIPASSNRRTVR